MQTQRADAQSARFSFTEVTMAKTKLGAGTLLAPLPAVLVSFAV